METTMRSSALRHWGEQHATLRGRRVRERARGGHPPVARWPVTVGAAAIVAAALIAGAFSTTARAQETDAMTQPPALAAEPASSGRIEANGISYYFETYGSGEPLLLLHGGLGTTDMFRPLLPMLSEGRELIAVDLHGHGRTPLGSRKINLIDIGDDLAVLLRELGRRQVDVLGYSFGGSAGLRLAVQHPELVRRLVIVSAGFSRNGFYPEMLAQQAQVGSGMAEMMRETPMYQSYAAVAPDPGEFPVLLDRMGELMKTPFDWSDDVERLSMPVMLVFGDSDMFRLEHVVEFYQLLGGGLRDAGWMRENMSPNRLAILPNLTHYEIFMAPELAATVRPFLNGGGTAPQWTERAAR
jgi:pimeloyl-ACP methyl ester carboxylesterase